MATSRPQARVAGAIDLAHAAVADCLDDLDGPRRVSGTMWRPIFRLARALQRVQHLIDVGARMRRVDLEADRLVTARNDGERQPDGEDAVVKEAA